MNRLFHTTLLVLASVPAFARWDNPENKFEVCQLSTLDGKNPQLEECYNSPASLENMKACHTSTILFETFMDCTRIVSDNTITPEKIRACGDATAMRSRFLNCVTSAKDPEVSLYEIQDCEKRADKQSFGGFRRGQFFSACVQEARNSVVEPVQADASATAAAAADAGNGATAMGAR